jgi:hypothetical protein
MANKQGPRTFGLTNKWRLKCAEASVTNIGIDFARDKWREYGMTRTADRIRSVPFYSELAAFQAVGW